jgi:SAM-dependent methyltransferase
MSGLWLAPPSIKWITRFSGRTGRILDVGCGFGSSMIFRRFCPNCEYYGLDQDRKSLAPGDEAWMRRFYEADLDTDTLSHVPDAYFDAIVLSHVIEHLRHGEECLIRLASKLKPGGVIYVEYPGVRSLNVPRAKRGFLHFHDDPTHVRIYSVPKISNVLLNAGCQILRAGTRRDPLRLSLSPIFAVRGILTRGDVWSGRLWDLFGIAEYVVARKV